MTREAFIERVRGRCGGRVEVDVLLADGGSATAVLDARDWDWLEAAAGDIVPLRWLGAAIVGA